MPTMGEMANLPRPLIGLLVATVAFFAVWTVALKPSASSSGPPSGSSSPSPAAAAQPQPSATTASHAAAPSASPAASLKPKRAMKPAVKHTSAASQRLDVIQNALTQHKVLAILFFNPAAADDQAVKHELDAVPNHGDKVVKLAVPLSELTRYPVITTQVQVTESPTLVLISANRKANVLTGFADQFELAQRVADTLSAK
jgi:hypothetical protein